MPNPRSFASEEHHSEFPTSFASYEHRSFIRGAPERVSEVLCIVLCVRGPPELHQRITGAKFPRSFCIGGPPELHQRSTRASFRGLLHHRSTGVASQACDFAHPCAFPSTSQDGAERVVFWHGFPEVSPVDDSPSTRTLDGEPLTMGDETMTKVRKPYTITKQRERWTEEEHQKFLEALKLYGRAWRRIEEHVGTKTAIQIRSHAQKFFSKLEREASGGLTAGSASEIDIPPPRPKRKPSHPYPRKAGVPFTPSSSTVEEDISLPQAAPDTIPAGPSSAEGHFKAAAFTPYIATLQPRPPQMATGGGRKAWPSSGSVKLFGQTVVVSAASVSREMTTRTGSMPLTLHKSAGEMVITTASLNEEACVPPGCDFYEETGRDNVSMQTNLGLQGKEALVPRSNDDYCAQGTSRTAALESTIIAVEKTVAFNSRDSEALQNDECPSEVQEEAQKKLPRPDLSEPTFSPEGTEALSKTTSAHNPQSETAHSNESPLEMYRQSLLTTVQHLAAPFHPLMQLRGTTPLQNGSPFLVDPLAIGHALYSSQTPAELGNLDSPSSVPGLVAPPGSGSSFPPWQLTQAAPFSNPTAFAAAAAAVAAFWPGLALGAPLHMPLRPPSNSDGPNIPEGTNVAAVAAAAASFAAASAWWALHGAISPAVVLPGIRPILRPNPAVPHTVSVAGQPPGCSASPKPEPQNTTGICEGPSNRGDDECKPTSSDEHEDSTANGLQEAVVQEKNPDLQKIHVDCCIEDYCSRPSVDHVEGNFMKGQTENMALQKRDKKRSIHNSTLDSRIHGGSKRRKGNYVPNCNTSLCDDSESDSGNGEGATCFLSGTEGISHNPGTIQGGGHNGPVQDEDQSSYSSECGNFPARSATPSVSEPSGGDCPLNENESKRAIKKQMLALQEKETTGNCSREQSICAIIVKEHQVLDQGIKNQTRAVSGGEEDVLMPFACCSSHAGPGEMFGEVSSLPPKQGECLSSCGSLVSKQGHMKGCVDMSLEKGCTICKFSVSYFNVNQGYGWKGHVEDSGSDIDPLKRVESVQIHVGSKRWEREDKLCLEDRRPDSSIFATLPEIENKVSACTDNEEETRYLAKVEEETGSSFGVTMDNEDKQQFHLLKVRGLTASAASSSGSTRYSGAGFVPYRRTSPDGGVVKSSKPERKQSRCGDQI